MVNKIEPVKEIVFPMHVGVNRLGLPYCELYDRIPHACGGEPLGIGMPWDA